MDYRKKFQLEYRKLNPKQKEAVDTIEGPVMVIAGPGTGKTQILALRIANILQIAQVNPSNILALTFTNSGAYQMKKRLLEIIGPPSYNVHIHTFHSFCNEVIGTFPEKFIIAKEINQLSDLEQITIIHQILDNGDFEYLKPLKSPYYYDKSIRKAIGDLKQENISPENFSKALKKEKDGKDLSKNLELFKIYQAYQQRLNQLGQYDYADMILFVLEAFKSDPEVLNFYQEKFQYILIDEYQDTNSAQNEIAETLASSSAQPNIFVVGDDEQSIFRFQGASIENILFFTQKYPEAKIVVLKENYRSTQKILDTSRVLISHNKNQIFGRLKVSKNLKSHHEQPIGGIYVGQFESGQVENFFVAKQIQELIKKGTRPSEIALIYREHRDSDEVADMLSRLGIPYKMEAGDNVLDDPEINKIIKILNSIENPNDDQALLEIMHYVFFNIPVIDAYKIANSAGVDRTHIFDIITSEKIDDLKLLKIKTVKKFIDLILECRLYAHNHTFADTFDFVINETGYLNFLLSLEDAVLHLNRLQSLFGEIKKNNIKNKNLNIKGFLEYLTALEENNLDILETPLDSNFEGVKLMTAHKAKGMEFDTVFLIHLSDKHWGNITKRNLIKLPTDLVKFQSVGDENDEEERRLFYVGLTRAKKNIYLSFANNYGEGPDSPGGIPSKFITELPEKNLTTIDAAKYEKQFDERLRLVFDEKKWHRSKALKSFIDELIEKFTLSATSLNAYLDCPRSFFLNQLLRVPKVKDFNQSYGTAVHFALENFFKIFKRDLTIPPKSLLIEYFAEGLTMEILAPIDLKRALKQGGEVLKKYYDFYQDSWEKKGPPMQCEYNFKYHNVKFGEIPISGIIDKIELVDKNALKVKIVDYKTSAPKSINQLLGKTKDARLAEFYQAYFYKLLSENDPLFKWQIAMVEFDFVSPRNNKFYKVGLPIEQNEFEKFKNLVKDTYREITEHKFEKNTKNCRRYNSTCEYFDLCQ